MCDLTWCLLPCSQLHVTSGEAGKKEGGWEVSQLHFCSIHDRRSGAFFLRTSQLGSVIFSELAGLPADAARGFFPWRLGRCSFSFPKALRKGGGEHHTHVKVCLCSVVPGNSRRLPGPPWISMINTAMLTDTAPARLLSARPLSTFD